MARYKSEKGRGPGLLIEVLFGKAMRKPWLVMTILLLGFVGKRWYEFSQQQGADARVAARHQTLTNELRSLRTENASLDHTVVSLNNTLKGVSVNTDTINSLVRELTITRARDEGSPARLAVLGQVIDQMILINSTLDEITNDWKAEFERQQASLRSKRQKEELEATKAQIEAAQKQAETDRKEAEASAAQRKKISDECRPVFVYAVKTLEQALSRQHQQKCFSSFTGFPAVLPSDAEICRMDQGTNSPWLCTVNVQGQSALTVKCVGLQTANGTNTAKMGGIVRNFARRRLPPLPTDKSAYYLVELSISCDVPGQSVQYSVSTVNLITLARSEELHGEKPKAEYQKLVDNALGLLIGAQASMIEHMR